MEESQEIKCLHGRKESHKNKKKSWKNHESWQTGERMVNKWMKGFYEN